MIISFSSETVRSAPSRSALLTTNTSPISRMPAFSICTSSPEPGWTSTETVSAVQMLKAGILEIGDVFVVNKADMDGAERTVAELEEMIHMRQNPAKNLNTGHHDPVDDDEMAAVAMDDEGETWEPSVVETVATTGDGVDELIDTLAGHAEWLVDTGEIEERARNRYAAEIRQLVRGDTAALLEEVIDEAGGIEALADRVLARETDPYSVTDELVGPLRDCVREELDDR